MLRKRLDKGFAFAFCKKYRCIKSAADFRRENALFRQAFTLDNMFLSNRCIFKSVVFAFMAQPPHTQGARRSFGGGEGSRTPVRRWVDRTFSGCRRLLEFSAVRHQSANAAPRYLFVCLASSKEKGKRTFITQFDARFCAVILAEGTGGINGRGTAVRLPMLLVC